MTSHCHVSVDWSPLSAFCSVCWWPPPCRNFSEGSGTRPRRPALSLSDVGPLGACQSQKFYLGDDKGEERRQERKLRLTWNKVVCQWPEKQKEHYKSNVWQTLNYCTSNFSKERLIAMSFFSFSASRLKISMSVCFSIWSLFMLHYVYFKRFNITCLLRLNISSWSLYTRSVRLSSRCSRTFICSCWWWS